MTFAKTLLGASALSVIAAPALAATMATATTDLNVRAGPGPDFPVQTVIAEDGQATVNGCIENSKWCQVSVNGTTGWAYSEYLVASVDGTQTVIVERPQAVGVDRITYDGPDGALAGAATGAVAGAFIGGPVGAAVGGAAGLIVGDQIDPAVTTYVESNPVEPVYLDGEAVVGARVPETVTLYEIPDARYRYVYANGQPILIDADSRQVVYVYR